MSLLLGTNGKPNPLRNEAPLNCVSLRSQLELQVTWEPGKGPDERPCGTPLTAPHVTTGGLCRWKAINKVGRHVGLDFYDLLIEGHFTQNPCGGILSVIEMFRQFTALAAIGMSDCS